MKLSEVELPSNKKFGLFFTAVFAAVGIYMLATAPGLIAYSMLSASALFLVASLFKPDLLLPLNRLWMRFGLLLGMIISPIVLGIIYFGLFSPIGLLMRLFGRDELRLKLSSGKSHWKERNSETPVATGFKNQF